MGADRGGYVGADMWERIEEDRSGYVGADRWRADMWERIEEDMLRADRRGGYERI